MKHVPETGTGSCTLDEARVCCISPVYRADRLTRSRPAPPASLCMLRVFWVSLQYALSIVIVSTCVSNGTSNWLQVQ